MKRQFRVSAAVFVTLAAIVFSCAAALAQTIDITLVHTNDTHGNLRKAWENGAKLTDTVTMVRKETEAKGAGNYFMLLDAGDITSYKTPSFEDVEKDIFQMGSLGYDAMALGNHEVDFGLDRFVELAKKAGFPVLCANMLYKDGGGYVFKPYVIKEFGKFRVAVIGLTHDIVLSALKPEDRARVEYLGTDEAYLRAVRDIGQKADAIFLLSHLGVEEDRAFARKHPEIKLIVGSHSHTLIDKPEFVGKTCIVQAGRFGENLGRLSVKAAGKELKSVDGGIIVVRPPKKK